MPFYTTGTPVRQGAALVALWPNDFAIQPYASRNHAADDPGKLLVLSANIGTQFQVIDGTEGDDTLIGTETSDEINGLGGNDYIDGGDGNDLLIGGPGLDMIYGGAGDDELIGGNGSDLISGGSGSDVIDGGDGIDTVQYQYEDFASFSINIGQAGSANSGGPVLAANQGNDAFGTIDTLISVENVVTGSGDDTILGNEESNRLESGYGLDVLDGRGGADILIGGYGWDFLSGGTGDDIFSGTASDLDGDTITDIEIGDRILIVDADVTDFQFSLSGNVLTYDGGSLTLSNIRSAIVVAESAAGGGILLTVTSNSIDGTDNGDVLNGTAAGDVIYGFGGNDTLNGLGGDDLFNGGLGNDVLNGDAGFDTATYLDASSGITVNLGLSTAQNTGGAGTDTLSSIEHLVGSAFDDALTGSAAANMFIGNAGNDTIDGGAGIDTIDYSRELSSGMIVVNLGATPVTLSNGLTLTTNQAVDAFGNIDTLTSIEHIITGSDYDYVIGSDADEVIETGALDDALFGGGGADVLIGGDGDDIYLFSLLQGDTIVELANGGIDELYSEDRDFSLVGFEQIEVLGGTLASGHDFGGNALDNTILGFSGADIIRGEGGDDYLAGGSGNDNLAGGEGADTLLGNNDNDTLNGGNGADTLQGGAGIDVLTGGTGSDSFIGSAASLTGDTITDFSTIDRIVIVGATLANFTFSFSGSTLTFTGGSLTLAGGISGSLIASRAAGGGVQLTIADVRNDFNGDGRSDILWRNVDGQLSNWLGQANGGFTPNNANAAAVVPIDWQIVSTGDFNGDGRDDILWRNTDGTLSNWLGTVAGGYTPNDANAAVVVPTDWNVVGTGDFNGDGRDDILWRNNDGTLSNWLGTASGGFTPNDANAARFVPTDWQVAGTGDFNGDGRDDILWRNDNGQLSNWLGQDNGGFILNDARALTNVDTAWHVVGTGDFNGDGQDDILWRNDDGQLSNWVGRADGGFYANNANAAVVVPTEWTVVAVGDYNGDGRDDILWRHTDGTLSNWLGTASGGFIPNDANAAVVVPTSWQVQPEPFLL